MKEKTVISFLASLVILIITASPSFSQCDTPDTDLGNDTTLCENTSLILNAGVADNYLWNDGTSGSTLEVSTGGEYWVEASNDCGSVSRDTILVTLVSVPDLFVNINTDKYYCKGETLELDFLVENPILSNIYTIERADNSTTVSSIDTSGTYRVSVLDENNCRASREFDVEFQYPYQNDKIKLVTYDNEEDKFVIVWSKTENKRTMSYLLYNGSTSADLMGESSFNSVNLMIDYKSDPHAKSEVYNLMLEDSCENKSDFNTLSAHKTMYLNVFTNGDNEMELNWEKYIGFDYDKYYIYRGTSSDKLELVDSIINESNQDINSYIDKNAVAGQQYYYQVLINTPETIYLDNDRKVSAGPYVHSLSNLEDNRLQGSGVNTMDVFAQNIKIYPNPITDNAQLSFTLNASSEIRIYLTDMLGKTIYTLFEGQNEAGINHFPMGEAYGKLNSGIYFLRCEIKDLGTCSKKIIKN